MVPFGSTEEMFRCIWLQQAYETKKRLGENFAELAGDDAVEIRIIKTTGDMILDKVSLQHTSYPRYYSGLWLFLAALLTPLRSGCSCGAGIVRDRREGSVHQGAGCGPAGRCPTSFPLLAHAIRIRPCLHVSCHLTPMPACAVEGGGHLRALDEGRAHVAARRHHPALQPAPRGLEGRLHLQQGTHPSAIERETSICGEVDGRGCLNVSCITSADL